MARTLTLAACVLILILSATGTNAGPVQSELKSYRCLVPDWSKTSGGTSPALSPDGKTLVYLVGDDQVWVMFNVDKYQPARTEGNASMRVPDSWQLRVNLPLAENPSVHVQLSGHIPGLRDVDWAPDSKRVAFTCNGRLFTVDYADLLAKSAKPTLLADIAIVPPENAPPGMDPTKDLFAEPVLGPRWSPDGKLIAFERPGAPGVANEICIVEPSTGKETVLARDVYSVYEVWEQPWSPDSKSLTYTSALVESGKTSGPGRVSVVSVLGGAPRNVISDSMVCRPSWSPLGDRLAYASRSMNFTPGKDTSTGSGLLTVYIVGVDGKNPAPLAPKVPSKAEIAAAEVKMGELLLAALRKKYSDVFTDAQLRKLAPGRISGLQVEAMLTLMTAEEIAQARVIGGEYKRQVEEALKRHPIEGKDSFAAAPDIWKAVNKLPQDKRPQLPSDLLSEVSRPYYEIWGTMDTTPVWSPDGSRLAFTRTESLAGTTGLVICDLATRKTRTVCEAGTIDSVTWTPDGNSLLLNARRNLAYSAEGSDSSSIIREFATMPSYPEVWLIDLK